MLRIAVLRRLPRRRSLPSVALGASALLAALAVVGCGGSSGSSNGSTGSSGGSSAKAIKVAAVYPGTLQGDAYTQVHNAAIESAIKAIGADKVTYRPVFGITYDERMTSTVTQLFQQGQDLVIDNLVAGQLFSAACKQTPDKKCLGNYAFTVPQTNPPAPNLSAFYQDNAPLFYVEGVAAGKLTRTGTVGFVSSFRQPFNSSVVNAFALGCQSVRPDCKLRNVYINAFYDPPKTVDAANSLLNSGADVLAHFLDDVTPVKVAQQHGDWGFGLYLDQRASAPRAWVTGIDYTRGLTRTYEDAFNAVLDGSWRAGQVYWGSPKPPDMDLAPWGTRVPADAKQAALDALAKIERGENPFRGPIKDASGRVRVPAGSEIGLRGPVVYSSWTWPVQGVIGL